MPCTTQDVIDQAGPALLNGDFDRILGFYAETVAVFTPDNVYRLSGRDDIRAALAEHRDGILRKGVIGLHGELAAVGLPRGPKFRTFVDWIYEMGDGTGPRRASATYFCVQGPRGPQVEMIEYRSLAFPDARRWHAGRALIRKPVEIAEDAA